MDPLALPETEQGTARPDKAIALAKALEEWEQLLGKNRVILKAHQINEWGRSLTPVSRIPAAVISPASIAEVQAAVGIASRHKVPVYPVSGGKNWGYGSACPIRQDNVLMDLGRLNRIVEVDRELAYAVVEPGVSQQQLYDYLETNHIPLHMDVTGAPPSASVLGNILERGYGQTPYSDHFMFSCGMDVVLPDGQLLKTGFGHYEHARTQYLYKWGVGPFLDGLFTQSNLGIVVRIGVWLMPKPEAVGMFYFKIADDSILGRVVEKLRTLRQKQVLVCAVHLFNDIRVISSLQQYPWDLTHGRTPLPEDVRERLIRKHRIAPWICAGGLRGTPAQIKWTLREIRRHLKGIARVQFVSERIFQFTFRHADLIKKMTGIDFKKKRTLYELNRGIPTEQPSVMPYWRSRRPVPGIDIDPVRDNCGLIWLSPVLPMRQEDILKMTRIGRDLCAVHGFEFNISINLVTARAVSCVIGIAYDREQAKERQRAADCHAALFAEMMSMGYVPYRMDTGTMADIIVPDPFWDVCARVKQCLDPNAILAPGRYNAI